MPIAEKKQTNPRWDSSPRSFDEVFNDILSFSLKPEQLVRLHDALTTLRSQSRYAHWEDYQVSMCVEAIEAQVPAKALKTLRAGPVVPRKRQPGSAATCPPPYVISKALQELADSLPYRPYVSSDLQYGSVIRPRSMAVGYPYIQLNPPSMLTWLVIDCDKPDAVERVRRAQADGLPVPNLVIENEQNGHAHLVFKLGTPVCTSEAGKRRKPYRVLQAIKLALNKLYEGDRGFRGPLSKNPLHLRWNTSFWREQPYEFSDFQGLTLDWNELWKSQGEDAVREQEAEEIGRNVSLFNAARKLAYKLRGDDIDDQVQRICERLNAAFPDPLDDREVRGIARSISRYLASGKYSCSEEFSELQSKRGRMGGRPRTTTAEGKPWEQAGMSRATWYRQQKAAAKAACDTAAEWRETKANQVSARMAGNKGFQGEFNGRAEETPCAKGAPSPNTAAGVCLDDARPLSSVADPAIEPSPHSLAWHSLGGVG